MVQLRRRAHGTGSRECARVPEGKQGHSREAGKRAAQEDGASAAGQFQRVFGSKWPRGSDTRPWRKAAGESGGNGRCGRGKNAARPIGESRLSPHSLQFTVQSNQTGCEQTRLSLCFEPWLAPGCRWLDPGNGSQQIRLAYTPKPMAVLYVAESYQHEIGKGQPIHSSGRAGRAEGQGLAGRAVS